MTLDQAKIPLLGGLGNQLFQLAALLSLDAKSSVLECSWGNARKTNNLEDIFYYKIVNGVTRSETKKFRTILQKGFNFMLRIQLKDLPRAYRWSSCFFWERAVSLVSRRSYALRASRELGFVNLRPTKKRSVLLHGYFQTYKYFETSDVKKKLMGLKLKSPPSAIKQYEQISIIERPLVVHIRRGDYKLENNFGILGDRYYEESLEIMWNKNFYGRIWLFSDEPEEALNVIPEAYRQYIRVIPNLDLVPAATLELMRLGLGYIIANSSFSWWGAMLSKHPNPTVIAPNKWFKNLADPACLIPPGWIKVNSHFES
jgi:hypothetical protein